MAISNLELHTVQKGFFIARKLLDEIKPVIDQLNVIYDSVGGVKDSLTQEEMDNVEAFGALTKTQLDDGMYVLTATLKDVLANGFSQLSKIAARG
jgi:hypothetical protein